MAGDQVARNRGGEPEGAEGRYGGDKAVDDHRAAAGCGTQKRTAHGADVEAAHFCKHIHRIIGVRAVKLQSLPDDGFFLHKGSIGDTAAPACHRFHVHIQQGRKHRRGGGGVADAHFTHAQNVGLGAPGQLIAGPDGGDGLFPGHGGSLGEVLGAVGNFPVQDLGLPDIGVDAYIADGDAAAEMAAEGGRAGFVAGQVDGLHQCHALGRTGNALGHHAVVGGEDQKVRMFHTVVKPTRDARHLDGQVLQPSETAGGLGQLGLPLPGFGHGGFIQRFDAGQNIL